MVSVAQFQFYKPTLPCVSRVVDIFRQFTVGEISVPEHVWGNIINLKKKPLYSLNIITFSILT